MYWAGLKRSWLSLEQSFGVWKPMFVLVTRWFVTGPPHISLHIVVALWGWNYRGDGGGIIRHPLVRHPPVPSDSLWHKGPAARLTSIYNVYITFKTQNTVHTFFCLQYKENVAARGITMHCNGSLPTMGSASSGENRYLRCRLGISGK